MSVGKKSLARVASVTAQKAEEKVEKTAEEGVQKTLAAEEVSHAEEVIATEIKSDEKFKNVQVGDDIPAFLL